MRRKPTEQTPRFATVEDVRNLFKRVWELENPPRFKVLDKVKWDYDNEISNCGAINTGRLLGTIVKIDVRDCTPHGIYRYYDIVLSASALSKFIPKTFHNNIKTWILEGSLQPAK